MAVLCILKEKIIVKNKVESKTIGTYTITTYRVGEASIWYTVEVEHSGRIVKKKIKLESLNSARARVDIFSKWVDKEIVKAKVRAQRERNKNKK